jgi:hypothetical protein
MRGHVCQISPLAYIILETTDKHRKLWAGFNFASSVPPTSYEAQIELLSNVYKTAYCTENWYTTQAIDLTGFDIHLLWI